MTHPDSDPLALRQNWIRVNATALAKNIQVLKRDVAVASHTTPEREDNQPSGILRAPSPKLMAVVKANAYGHGFEAARYLRDAGADAFGVTTLDEALAVQQAGIDTHATPILLFAPLTDAAQARLAVERGFHITVCDSGHLDLIEAAERETGAAAFPHLKVDTGMGRLGLNVEAATTLARRRAQWAGAYTHFARASEKNLAPTRAAFNKFLTFTRDCGGSGIDFGIRHCANSAAALRLPESRLDMVRLGTIVYGQMPTSYAARPAGLSDATFQAQARVVFVHDLFPGDTVGYGSEFTASKQMRVAVVPVGFADGFGVAPVSLYRGWRGVRQIVADRNREPYVLLRGKKALVLGRVAMQMIVVDVTGFEPRIAPGEIADVPMRRLSANRMPLVYDS